MTQLIDLIVRAVVTKTTPEAMLEAGQMIVQQQQRARDDFGSILAASNLHHWSPDEPMWMGTKWFVIGADTASIYDMAFLDTLDQALNDGIIPSDHRFDVFHICDYYSFRLLTPYLPDVRPLIQSPVLGLWEYGTLKSSAQGPLARRMVLETYGLPVPQF